MISIWIWQPHEGRDHEQSCCLEQLWHMAVKDECDFDVLELSCVWAQAGLNTQWTSRGTETAKGGRNKVGEICFED